MEQKNIAALVSPESLPVQLNLQKGQTIEIMELALDSKPGPFPARQKQPGIQQE